MPGRFTIADVELADLDHQTLYPAFVAKDEPANLPTAFALAQNYPNPFNPRTAIKFALPVATHVRLEVFNVLGQRVAVLKDEPMAAGRHEVTWDGANTHGKSVATGVYLYRLTTEQYTETRKMVLLK